jgi:hypothetical protein
MAFTAAQIVAEIITYTIFGNLYNNPTNNPFQPTAQYCAQPNGTAAILNFNLALNNSAAWAVLFGCNASLDSFPLDSVGATCGDSVFGCLVMSLYRLLLEIVTILEKLVCYFSMSVQFNAALGITWADLDLQGPFRQAINVAECLRRFLYAFIYRAFSHPPSQRPSKWSIRHLLLRLVVVAVAQEVLGGAHGRVAMIRPTNDT